MKYGIVIKLLMVACVSIVQLTGCSSDTEELEKSVSGIPIRIVAEMNGGTGISQMTKASVRSSGEWKENYIGAEEYEKTVKQYGELSGKSYFLLFPRNNQPVGGYNRH